MAIAGYLAFIAYGGLADLGPVLLLHLLLLPVNALRLTVWREAAPTAALLPAPPHEDRSPWSQ